LSSLWQGYASVLTRKTCQL